MECAPKGVMRLVKMASNVGEDLKTGLIFASDEVVFI